MEPLHREVLARVDFDLHPRPPYRLRGRLKTIEELHAIARLLGLRLTKPTIERFLDL